MPMELEQEEVDKDLKHVVKHPLGIVPAACTAPQVLLGRGFPQQNLLGGHLEANGRKSRRARA